MAENVTQRKEEDKEKKQNFTNYVREFVGGKDKSKLTTSKQDSAQMHSRLRKPQNSDRKVSGRE